MNTSHLKSGKKPIWKRWWMFCIYALVLLMIGTSLGGGGDATTADANPSTSATSLSPVASAESQLKKMGADESAASAVAHATKAPTSAKPTADESTTSGGITQTIAGQTCDKEATRQVAAEGGKWKGHWVAGVVNARSLGDVFFISYQGEVENAAGGEIPALLNCTVGGSKDSPQIVSAKIVQDQSR